MKNKKYEIDYTNFDPEKEYVVNNDQVKRPHSQILADHDRSSFMKEAHKSEDRKQISVEGGKIGIQSALQWRKENPEEFHKMVVQNGKNSAKKTMENGTGLFGLTDEERKINATLGGSANTEKQKEARAKQIREHFQVKGTEAAAIAATKKFNAKIEQMLPLLPDDWFTVKEFEAIKKTTGIKRFNCRNALVQEKYFTRKKVSHTYFYKKVTK